MREIKAIVAVDRNYAIGKDNKMMWHIKDDFKHFKEVTSGAMVFMGRKTYQSIGMSLPNRQNVILTTDKTLKKYNENDIIVHSYTELEDVIDKTLPTTDVFCIGGGQLYEKYIDVFSDIYLTRVYKTVDEPDTYFPQFEKLLYNRSKPRPLFNSDDKDGNSKVVCEYYKYSKKLNNISDEFITTVIKGWLNLELYLLVVLI